MDKVFSGLKDLIKLKTLSIDNHVFRLHYRVTVLLLMGASILVTSKQYIGDPIDCISKDSVPSKILDTFCWTHSTFSVKHAWHKKVGTQVPYPGIDKSTPGDERVYHAYYQWVCFVLFFQAALFYLPRYLWKAAEGHKIHSLVLNMSDPLYAGRRKAGEKDTEENPNNKNAKEKASDKDAKEKKYDNVELLCDYFKETKGHHRGYVLCFLLCELLNFINVVGQMYLVDRFLGGEFQTYGSKVLQFTEWDPMVRFDPMIKVFPRLTKCIFHMYGSSGDVQKYDAMCILPINIINEKIYVFMWFWFLFLSCASALMLVYRVAIILCRPLRSLVLDARTPLASTECLRRICNDNDLGDWFLLNLLSKNLDSVAYRDFVKELDIRSSNKSPMNNC